jgi:hypothetical protein
MSRKCIRKDLFTVPFCTGIYFLPRYVPSQIENCYKLLGFESAC